MPRPKKNRKVLEPPLFTEFKPVGIGGNMIDDVVMSIDEYEAFRLADFLGMSQEEAAEEMEISRPTFTRLIESARKKVAEMMVKGKRLTITGGNIEFRQNLVRGFNCGHLFRINFAETIEKCPVCGSTNLVHLGFGRHGHGMGRGGRHGHGWKF